MIPQPERVLERLRELQRLIRGAVLRSRDQGDLAAVTRTTAADTIYGIDAAIEPVIEHYCEEWGRELPMVVVAEGIEPETGRVFPEGLAEGEAVVRVIMDPIDGTRGLMYDKRSAWSLAGVAPNKGEGTRLSDIEVAVMTELPTSKMAWGDVLWAVRGGGAHGTREALEGKGERPLKIAPSKAEGIAHGFAMVSNFFPGTKVLASALMEAIASSLLGAVDLAQANVFDDQYISTGGQFYELIVGHDRFNADLRPLFYGLMGKGENAGLCCHPYDCCTMLVAEEAGVEITDGRGGRLDGPLDVTTGLAWAGFANGALRAAIEPLMMKFFEEKRRG